MVIRTTLKQDEHDGVIEALEQVYRKRRHRVYKNPDGEQNTNIKGHPDLWPDLIVVDAENRVRFIEEVETEDSVSELHAREQWVPYSRIGTDLYLRVPYGSHTRARRIVRSLGLNASVMCYRMYADQVYFVEC